MDIFIIEDDRALLRELNLALSKWGYKVTEVVDFENITNEVIEAKPKLILMDINLPLFDGFYWCHMIRNIIKVPIIFISSRDSEMDIIMAVNMGGDDYVTKPFSPQLLIAKVQAVLRRTYSYNSELQTEIIKCGDVVLNLFEGKLTYHHQEIELTKNEFKILQLLMKKQGMIVMREEIIEALWDTNEFISENTLTVNMNRLRKKLDNIGVTDFIVTKKAQGCMIL